MTPAEAATEGVTDRRVAVVLRMEAVSAHERMELPLQAGRVEETVLHSLLMT